jgi:hypothetical protein
MTNNYFLKQLNSVLNDFSALQSQAKYEDLSDILQDKIENLTNLISRSKATVERIVGTSSEYYKDVIRSIEAREHYGTKLRLIIGTVRALKSDLENDYLKSLHDIVQSEIFSDYLDMATYLISEGFKDPSAVIIGSTLEAHLRELCKTNSIDIEITNSKGNLVPKKADVMNADLAKAGIYSSAYQKQITAWLGLRNSAAHGHYTEYSAEEIKLMLNGVRQFILMTT